MHIFFLLSIIGCLTIIAFQDFSQRSVTLWVLVVLLAASSGLSWTESNWNSLLHKTYPTAGFLILVLAVLLLYYRIKGQKIKDVVDQKLGMGDILFLAAVIPLFSLTGFIVFFLSSLIIILIGALVYEKTTRKGTLIPLAGLQALCLITTLGLNELFWKQTYTGGFMFADILWTRLQNIMGTGA